MKQFLIFLAFCCFAIAADSENLQDTKKPKIDENKTQDSQNYDYKHCLNYYEQASVKVAGTRAVALKHNGKVALVLYSKTRPNAKILKADPKIGLYLISASAPKLAYDLLEIDERTRNDKNLVAITHTSNASALPKGQILKRQSSYLKHAKFSDKLAQNSVIGNICYQIYGIGGFGQNFIEKKYIERFLNASTSENGVVLYGDIGIRFLHDKNIVEFVDPFFENNVFKKGDEILSINAEKTPNYESVEWAVSNLEIGKIAQVQVRRNGKILNLQTRAQVMYGGFLLPDTFLEKYGVTLDENLQITEFKTISTQPLENSRFKGLKLGDKIIWVNKKEVNLDNIKKIWTDTLRPDETHRFDGKIQLLIHRGEAEFFIKI